VERGWLPLDKAKWTDVFVLCHNGGMMQIMSKRHYALKVSNETWNICFSCSEWPYDAQIDMEGGCLQCYGARQISHFTDCFSHTDGSMTQTSKWREDSGRWAGQSGQMCFDCVTMVI